MGFFFPFRDGRDRPYLGTARPSVSLHHPRVSSGTWTGTWSTCVSHRLRALRARPPEGHDAQARGCRARSAAEAKETGVVKANVARANPCPGGRARDSRRGLESSSGRSRTTPDDPGSREAMESGNRAVSPSAWDSGNHAASPSARDCGSASVLGTGTWSRCWRRNRKKATCASWRAVSPSGRALHPPHAPASAPSRPHAWPAPHRPLPFCVACQQAIISLTGKPATYFSCRAFGVSLESLGSSLGLNNCWVRDGLAMYGRSCGAALHSYE